ncbi:hypothetical protein [Paenibacillus sp. FSL L8-0463]
MVLTEKGSQLLPEAQKILASIDDFHYKASDLLTNSTEPIRIGLNTDGQVLQIKPMWHTAEIEYEGALKRR